MSDDIHTLAAAVVQSPHWRWMPGMLARASDANVRLRIINPRDYIPPDAVPDLRDPATIGCLMALLANISSMRVRGTVACLAAAEHGFTSRRTVDVIVAELLAAPPPAR